MTDKNTWQRTGSMQLTPSQHSQSAMAWYMRLFNPVYLLNSRGEEESAGVPENGRVQFVGSPRRPELVGDRRRRVDTRPGQRRPPTFNRSEARDRILLTGWRISGGWKDFFSRMGPVFTGNFASHICIWLEKINCIYWNHHCGLISNNKIIFYIKKIIN